MVKMGFSLDEIQESLKNNKYDEVMAIYLLLDENRLTSNDTINIDNAYSQKISNENISSARTKQPRNEGYKYGKENKRHADSRSNER